MYYEILIYLKYLFATFGFPTLETEKYQIFLKPPKNCWVDKVMLTKLKIL